MSQSLKEILHFIKTQPIRISVFGEFSAGKTTFINGLIGEAILTVAVDPTTAVPTYIRYAQEFNILVYLQNGNTLKLYEDEPPFFALFVGRQSVFNILKKQEGEIREFLKEWTKEGERADEVENITIELPLPWLKNNIELVDTPGLNNEITIHQKHTKDVAIDSDIAIFIFNAKDGGIKKSEFVDMIYPFQQYVSHSIVVMNQMDRLDTNEDDEDEENEREDILNYIKNDSLPNHWKGVILPQVFGISSLVRLDKILANNEPELLQEFDKLIYFVENIATKERGKILLNRLSNPEKKLFAQATQLESENKFDKAYKTYYSLYEILKVAEFDVSPARDGIQRCEKVLNEHVTELGKINKDINDAFALEIKEPDKAIKELRKAQKRLKEMYAPDEDVDEVVKRIAIRIRIRNKARKDIDGIKEFALTEENKGNLIQAVEIIKGFHEHTGLAELHKNTRQELVDLEKGLIKNRDNQCLEKWESIRQKTDLYFEKHQYNKARSVIPNIEKIQPFLSNELQKQAKHLLNSIKTQYNQWKDYRKLFRTLRTNILQQFESSAVNSKEIINILPDLKTLEEQCLHFFPVLKKVPKLTFSTDTILTVNERLQTVKYLLNYKGKFDGKTLGKLKKTLLEREEELAAVPDDPKAWFDNPSYFEKYPDHQTALSSVTGLVVNKKLKFNEAYQLLLGLNAIKPYLNTEIRNVVYEKEIELTKLLVKKRYFVFKTKNVLLTKLIDDALFSSAIYVTKLIKYEPNTFPILATIAEKQVKTGDVDGAKRTFETAIATIKNNDYSLSFQIENLRPIRYRISKCEFKYGANLHIYTGVQTLINRNKRLIANENKIIQKRKKEEEKRREEEEKRREEEEKRGEEISDVRSNAMRYLWIFCLFLTPFTFGITIVIGIIGSILIGMGLFDD